MFRKCRTILAQREKKYNWKACTKKEEGFCVKVTIFQHITLTGWFSVRNAPESYCFCIIIFHHDSFHTIGGQNTTKKRPTLQSVSNIYVTGNGFSSLITSMLSHLLFQNLLFNFPYTSANKSEMTNTITEMITTATASIGGLPNSLSPIRMKITSITPACTR